MLELLDLAIYIGWATNLFVCWWLLVMVIGFIRLASFWDWLFIIIWLAGIVVIVWIVSMLLMLI